jgi:hypothetical protein
MGIGGGCGSVDEKEERDLEKFTLIYLQLSRYSEGPCISEGHLYFWCFESNLHSPHPD